MKLSEAILKGCEGTRQCFEAFCSGDNYCCALGAAFYGLEGRIGTGMNKVIERRLLEEWHILKKDDDRSELYLQIIARNDQEMESRESIAAWLASIGY